MGKKKVSSKSLSADQPFYIPKIRIEIKNEEQKEALKKMDANAITFLLGPAGTGKTFLAIAYAINAFLDQKIEKIVLTRPVIEAAGERLGHLPGDYEDKINPYMIPLLDFLHEHLDRTNVNKFFAEGRFELAPLAYMRGRTLKNSFIILDEAQNAKRDQILMLLTRIGENSKIVCTGDPLQSDLNGKGRLAEIAEKLSAKVAGIATQHLTRSVRHPMIEKIIEAFEDIK